MVTTLHKCASWAQKRIRPSVERDLRSSGPRSLLKQRLQNDADDSMPSDSDGRDDES